MNREAAMSLERAAAEGRFADSGVADDVSELIAREHGEEALAFLERAVEGDQDGLFWLNLSSAAKALGLPERAETYRRRLAATDLAGGDLGRRVPAGGGDSCEAAPG